MKKDDIKTKENIAKLEKVIEEKKSIPKDFNLNVKKKVEKKIRLKISYLL